MENKVQAPAIALMVAGCLSGLICIAYIALNVLGVGMGTLFAQGGTDRFAQLLSGSLGIAISLAGLGLQGFIIYGGTKMKSLEGWGISLAAAIAASCSLVLACIPTCGCCFVNAPAGIWALVVLLSADVKTAFTS